MAITGSAFATVIAPKALLKADKAHGIMTLNTETTQSGVPPEAWLYKLGNRSALEPGFCDPFWELPMELLPDWGMRLTPGEPRKIRVAPDPRRIVRGREPQGWGEAPTGFARGAGRGWPSPFIERPLDQHKEKKPKDPTIREKFNTYRFADYKEKVIDLLTRVTTVSVKTVAVTEAMKKAQR